ncbi:MAG: hypothetical protein ACOC4M_11780 [Promethearchaeia archaeon]
MGEKEIYWLYGMGIGDNSPESLFAVCSIIFMPIAIATYFLSKEAQKTENINKYNKRAQLLSIIGIIMVSIFIFLCAVATSVSLGLYLLSFYLRAREKL